MSFNTVWKIFKISKDCKIKLWLLKIKNYLNNQINIYAIYMHTFYYKIECIIFDGISVKMTEIYMIVK